MQATPASQPKTLKQRAGHHIRVMVAGLCVVVIPLVIVYGVIEKLQSILEKAIPAIQPTVQELGGPLVALLMVLGVMLLSWLIGLVMTKTELGQRFLAWEKAVFAKHSKVMKKKAEHDAKVADEEAKAKVNARPALAHVHGGWQPGLIMEDAAGGRLGVYVPDLPSTETGRLYCVEDEAVVPVDMPVEEFKAALKAHGHGAGQWVKLLAERGS